MTKRKALASLYLILVPCLILLLTVKACNGCRDWLIYNGAVNIAGYTERQAQDEARRLLTLKRRPEEIKSAEQDIREVFNDSFVQSTEKARGNLRLVFEKYGIRWDRR